MLVADAVDAVRVRIAEGYRRFPQAQPDAWGSLELGSNAATELLLRLDAEERGTGQPAL